MGTIDHAAFRLLELMLELVHHTIHSYQQRTTGSMCSDRPAVTADEDFAALVIGDPRIVLLGKADLGPIEPRAEPTEPTHLLSGQLSDFVGHDVLAVCDDHVHLSASLGSLCWFWV